MDKGLEEQLERVRKLSARVGEIHEQLVQNTELITRDRERTVGTPLHEVRDLRQYPSAPWPARAQAAHKEPARRFRRSKPRR